MSHNIVTINGKEPDVQGGSTLAPSVLRYNDERVSGGAM